MTALTPEAFMAQPIEPDEDETPVDPIPQLTPPAQAAPTVNPMVSIAESMQRLVEHVERNSVTAQESTAWLSEGLADLEEKHATLNALVEEIEAIIKPSTSKLANQVRDAIKAWRAPEVPKIEGGHGEGFGTGLPNDVDYTDTEVKAAEFLADESQHPAHDAGIGIWRAYAAQMGVDPIAAASMNRSQIRTALGIEQPEAGA